MRRFIKILLGIVLVMACVPLCLLLLWYWNSDMGKPGLAVDAGQYEVRDSGGRTYCRESYLEYDSCGLWLLYLEGSGQDRGAKQGALTRDLMRFQEDVFVRQIREWIPSDRYLGFLRFLLLAFNRDLGEHVPLEYRDEIAGMSMFCTHDYDAIGTPYERQLNYHAAHDIGHAMQQYMLVGCSSFGVWKDHSLSGGLLVGRNFDFYMGDDFAKNKVVMFVAPDSGYRYASIAWPGMVGVVSGMNARGVTVTINAAKGSMPLSAATPISILAREILQYADCIETAYVIAQNTETFVSESILIGSVSDGCCAVIEKTPKETVLYRSSGHRIACTNHYLSEELGKTDWNLENVETSDSKYRYNRLEELLTDSVPMDYKSAIAVLRNRFGIGGKDIGIGNEKTLNQSIAHHSVVFSPEDCRMWVSTFPWQSGRFACYDLSAFFLRDSLPRRDDLLDMPADSVFMNSDYPSLLAYREGLQRLKAAVKARIRLPESYVESFLKSNPFHYHAYQAVGDYYQAFSDIKAANRMYERALQCEIPWQSDKREIEKQLKRTEQ